MRKRGLDRSQLVYREILQLARTGLRGDLAASVVRLQGRPGYRLRVGEYRVLFDLSERTLIILDIMPRSHGYR